MFDEDIKKTQEEIDNLTKKKKESIVEGIADEETDNKLKKAINRLKELKKEQEKTGEVDASSWVSSINETISAVQSAIGVFNDLAKAIGGVENSDLDKAFSVIDKAGQGAAIGAQIGQGYGAIIGAVVGAATGLISIFAGAENERITDKVEESERAVKRLENAYKNLEFAIESAYGSNVIGAKQAAIANKELQLAELQRQLTLEKSRDSKHRDEDRIIELQGQIIDLRNEIKRSSQEIATELLGISSVADAAMQFMDTYIEALRKGEDAQLAFKGSFKEMIASMIKQLWVTKVIGPQLEALVDDLNERIKSRSEIETEAYRQAAEKQATVENMSNDELRKHIAQEDEKAKNLYQAYVTARDAYWGSKGSIGSMSSISSMAMESWEAMYNADKAYKEYVEGIDVENYRKQAEQRTKEAKRELDKATAPTIQDMDLVAQSGKDLLPLLQASDEQLNELLKRYELFADDESTSKLSALQQGIQGVTEETAGAVEAYLNGMSQQAYLRNDLLTQIRDTIMSFDMDVQLGVFSQMLLQLQNNYIVMQSMQSMMEGWTTPSGQGIRVELLS